MFIGRFQPPHLGHSWLFEQKLNQVIPILIVIRDIAPDEKKFIVSRVSKIIVGKSLFGTGCKSNYHSRH